MCIGPIRRDFPLSLRPVPQPSSSTTDGYAAHHKINKAVNPSGGGGGALSPDQRDSTSSVSPLLPRVDTSAELKSTKDALRHAEV